MTISRSLPMRLKKSHEMYAIYIICSFVVKKNNQCLFFLLRHGLMILPPETF